MSRMTVVKFLTSLIALTFAVVLVMPLDAADRRRGVSPSETVAGVVVDVSTDSLTLRNAGGDHTLRITRRTTIDGDVVPAAQARARYVTDRDGVMVALRVKAESETLELRGVILERSATGLLLRTRGAEVEVSVDDRTLVVVEGSPSTPDALAVGDHVEVEAMYTESGILVAQLVVAEMDNIELHGVILALSPDAISLENATGVVDVRLSAETVVRIFGYRSDLDDLRVGMHVEIEAERLPDTTLAAIVIEVEDHFNLVEVEGVIVSSDDSVLRLLTSSGSEVSISITSDTIVVWKGRILDAADLEAGDHVEVKAVRNGEGALTALRIKLENDEEDLDGIEGSILSVEGSLLTIAAHDGASVTILIGESTIIRVERDAGTVADLVPGRRVEVHVEVNPDGSLTAISIKVELEDDDDHEVEVHGVVAGVSEDSITVVTMHGNEVVFIVDEQTIVRRHHETIPFSDVRVGDRVEVEGVADSDGALTATKIDVEDEEEVETKGEVVDVSSTSITVLDSEGEWTFEVTEETRIRVDGILATITDVLSGDEAEVEGYVRSGSLVAKHIEIERDDD